MYTKNRFTGEKILKSPLKLIGAKTKIRDLLYPYFPKHERYIEPFMGTDGVLIGKPIAGELEYVGDLNQYAIHFFRTIIEEPENFWGVYQDCLRELCSGGKEEFLFIRSRVTDPYLTDAVKASYFYLISKCCMNGVWRLNQAGKCNSSYCGQTHGRGFMDEKWFNEVRQRIKDVVFYNCDYRDLLYLNGELPGSFMFLDPPYRACKTTYNGISFKDSDFYEMKELLSESKGRFKGKWLLTINDDQFIRNLFKDYDMIEHDVHYSCSNSGTKGRGKHPELLIANYDLNQTRKNNELSISTTSQSGVA